MRYFKAQVVLEAVTKVSESIGMKTKLTIKSSGSSGMKLRNWAHIPDRNLGRSG